MTPLPSILIVDDEPSAIETLNDALQGLGQIHYATSGLEALAFLADHPCDLVLLDAHMPEMDGFATCQAIQRDTPQLPVLFVTAACDFATEVRALESGAHDFIGKPINPPVVRARVSLHLKFKALYDQMHDLSARDPLTGLANRRALDERVTQEWGRAARHGQPLGLLMIDIDHFKSYNDHYGHLQGDACLRWVAQTIQETVNRTGDLVARYGGEEFAILLPGSDTNTAIALAEKIRAAMALLAIPHDDSDTAPCVTLSLGVASIRPALPPGQQPPSPAPPTTPAEAGLQQARDLFDRADRALYAAKAAGRNRVSASDTGPAPASVPLTLSWSRSYTSGHALIDEDHRALFQQANALLKLAPVEPPPAPLIPALDALLTLVSAHFDREEAVLREVGYPDTETHARLHRGLTDRALALRAQAAAGTLAFCDLMEYLVIEVVMGHLLRDDRLFFPWLRQAERP